MSNRMPSDDEPWHVVANQGAAAACKVYGVSDAWASRLRDCVLGIIAVESRYGRSPRYHAKRLLRHAVSRSPRLSMLAPRAQGLAQIDAGRVQYLTADACPIDGLDACTRSGALTITALGLAKAASLHFPRSSCPPDDDQLAILAITHNAGWMIPRVARLQMVLDKLDPFGSCLPYSGVAGPATLAALDRFAGRLSCPTLGAVLEASGVDVPPALGLTHPDLFPIFNGSDLFQGLIGAASVVGENLDEPLFPRYRFRRWYTGWISSEGYARAVLDHANDWRNRSITSRGGSSNSKGR